jgi:MmyB-like transcription regulator ligand binding domain
LQHSHRLRAVIDNWPDVARHMILRLRSESARHGHDPVLSDAAAQLALHMSDTPMDDGHLGTAVLSTRYRLNGVELSLFSMLAQFSSAEDIALADLKIELMFPADEATRAFLVGKGEAE